jgi:FAD dependent oxidoreductase TIGR03364
MTSFRRALDAADLVVVGGGIVGLAHAYAAVRRGLSVVVIERDGRAVGASIRNFGHGCVTAQRGAALEYALSAREAWLTLAREAGVWLRQSGAVVVARAEEELAVLNEFALLRGDQVALLDADGVSDRVPAAADVVGGALLRLDVRVNPRQAVSAIAAWLARDHAVRFHWSTTAYTVEPGVVSTSRGVVRAARGVVVAVGHDVDRHFPELAENAGIQRCDLHMLRVRAPYARVIEPVVLSGWSLLRYDGFADCPSQSAVRERMSDLHPDLVAAGLNLMLTQLPGGDLTIGDTHGYGHTVAPYRGEAFDDLVLAETARLLGVPRLEVVERWQGVYASAPEPFFIETPAPGVRVVSVTSGIGMTTALGLGSAVLNDLVDF